MSTPRRAIPIAAAAMAAVSVAALVASPQSSAGRRPSTQAPIPADAFRPVSLPGTDSTDNLTGAPEMGAPEARLERGGAVPGPRDRDRIVRNAQVSDRSVPDLGGPDLAPKTRPEPSPPDGPIHAIRPGDNLWLIAAWHQVGLEPILTWNLGVDPRHLVAGQRILVPGGAPMSANATAPTPRPTGAQAPAQPLISAPVSMESGDHLWPLPVAGLITRRFSGAHPGIDISAPAGTPVGAIAGGTVTWAGWRMNGGGYVVEIVHLDGMVSTYNHNREVVVSEGQVVGAGELVAMVGATGLATGPHLDLRVEMGGRLVDPLELY